MLEAQMKIQANGDLRFVHYKTWGAVCYFFYHRSYITCRGYRYEIFPGQGGEFPTRRSNPDGKEVWRCTYFG